MAIYSGDSSVHWGKGTVQTCWRLLDAAGNKLTLITETQSVIMPPILVCLGCHNKILQTGWIKQQKFISHSSGGWEVQDQVDVKVGFILRPLLFTCRWSPSPCMLIWPLLCAHVKRERMNSLLSLLIRAPILLDQVPTLMISLNLNYLITYVFTRLISKYSYTGG